jgi:serine/threonine-protein kinase
MPFNVGEPAGDYQIIGIPATGGEVYKVRNTTSDRVEAMEVLLPDLANEAELAGRFMREIQLLASLDHPNIATLYTAMPISNQLVVTMEFVEGRTLEERLKDGPLPAREAIEYACQALAALGYAHERGVVHGDIRPANLMVTADGQVKLTDFGIAKVVADRRPAAAGTTLDYMSPEQANGGADLDGRADVYSMGVTLHELVTGTRQPVQLDSSLPPVLNEIILVAIEKDPANRFRTAQAFRAALGSVAETLPQAAPAVTAAPEPVQQPQPAPMAPAPAAQAAPQRSGHRGLWMALGAVLAIAVLAVAAIQVPKWYRARAGAPPQEAVPAESAPASIPAAAPIEPVAQPAEAPAAPVSAVEAAAPAPVATPAVPSRTAREPRRVPVSPPAEPAVQPPAQSAPQQPQELAPAAPVQPAAPAVDTAALEEARDRMGMFGPRANALRSSLQNLEQQQKAQGLGLRTDISAAWRRMEGLLDEAEAALKSGDAGRAKTKLDQAERDADRLDKFLGR